ncbi:ribonuclease domain-containing protein [Papillibacter cinnamivorans]|nr:ribonuclease domain-containing protein [Papillibacter cinnamivorans]
MTSNRTIAGLDALHGAWERSREKKKLPETAGSNTTPVAGIKNLPNPDPTNPPEIEYPIPRQSNTARPEPLPLYPEKPDIPVQSNVDKIREEAEAVRSSPQTSYSPPSDGSRYINGLYGSLSGTGSAAARNLETAAFREAEQVAVEPFYSAARAASAADAAQGEASWDRYAAARGLNSGASGQAELALNSAYQSSLTSLNKAQEEKEADAKLQRQKIAAEYTALIEEVRAEREAAEAEALLKEYNRQIELGKQDEARKYGQNLKKAALFADTGDYSYFRSLGYSDEEIANMEVSYKRQQEKRREQEEAERQAAAQKAAKITASQAARTAAETVAIPDFKDYGAAADFMNRYGADSAYTARMLTENEWNRALKDESSSLVLLGDYPNYLKWFAYYALEKSGQGGEASPESFTVWFEKQTGLDHVNSTELNRSFREYEQAQETAPRAPAYVTVRNALAESAADTQTGQSAQASSPKTAGYLSVRNALDSGAADSAPGSVLLSLADSLKDTGNGKRITDLLRDFREYERKPDTSAADSRMFRENRYAEKNMASPSDRLKSLEKEIQLQKAKVQGLSDAYLYGDAEREQKKLDLLEKQYASENKRDLDRFIAEWTEEIDRQRQEQREQEILDLYNLYVPLNEETLASQKEEGYTGNRETAEQDNQPYINAVTPEMHRELQGHEKQWTDFKSQFSDDREMRKYLVSLGPEGIAELPEAVQFRAKLYYDNIIRNAEEYLAYEGYGKIPWLAALGSKFLDVMTLGASGKLMESSDPSKAEQLETAEALYPLAAQAGALAGWMTPGSASGAAAEGIGKALSPLYKPAGEIIGKGVQSALGKTAPKAASVLERILTNAAERGIAGYGVGAFEGALDSKSEGGDWQDVLKAANETGLRSAVQNMLANALLDEFKWHLNSQNPVTESAGENFTSGSVNDLPSNAQNSYKNYEGNNWKGNYSGQMPGTKAGKLYQNADDLLPKTDSAGYRITYREFDINSPTQNFGRDAERFVVGSDGSVYYTDSHYGQRISPAGLPPFVKIK